MSTKSHKVVVTKAFVHEGKIRTPKTQLTLPESFAKPLLEAGKVVLAKGADEAGAKSGGKTEPKAGAKAAAPDAGNGTGA